MVGLFHYQVLPWRSSRVYPLISVSKRGSRSIARRSGSLEGFGLRSKYFTVDPLWGTGIEIHIALPLAWNPAPADKANP